MSEHQSHVDKGKFAEQLAYDFLIKKSYRVVARNFYTRHGEIDIIFYDKDQLVFCEVKAKYTTRFGLPEDEFNIAKYEKFNNAVLEYLYKHDVVDDHYRIDLIALQLDEATRVCRLRHYKGYY